MELGSACRLICVTTVYPESAQTCFFKLLLVTVANTICCSVFSHFCATKNVHAYLLYIYTCATFFYNVLHELWINTSHNRYELLSYWINWVRWTIITVQCRTLLIFRRLLLYRLEPVTCCSLDLNDNCQTPGGYSGNGAYGHDIADSCWLLKSGNESNEVMESGNEFHSVIVLAAKDVWNWVEAQRGILVSVW